MENNENQMEQWNDVKEKKGSGLIIVLLLLIIIGMGIFIYLNKDKLFEPKTTEPEEEETITFTDTELQEYVDLINPVSSGPSKMIFGVDKVEASNMTAREKIEYIGHLVYEKQTNSSDYAYSIITEKDVKNAVEKVYGEDNYENTVFNLGCGDYNFHEDDNSYYSQTGCGGITNIITKNLVIDYEATKNKLEITTAYAFANPDGIYKDFTDNATVETLLEEYQEMDSNVVMKKLANYIEEHKDELHHITYVFESEDGENYYFKKFTRK